MHPAAATAVVLTVNGAASTPPADVRVSLPTADHLTSTTK